MITLKADGLSFPGDIYIWKTQWWPQAWKRSVSFQSQRKAMPKNAQTTTQLHSSHRLVNNAQDTLSQTSAIREP